MHRVRDYIIAVIIIALFLAGIFTAYRPVWCKSQMKKINSSIEQCEKSGDDSQCYSKLLDKYNQHLLRFHYANSLLKEKKYLESIAQYRIIYTNKTDKNTKYEACKYDNSQLADTSYSNMRKASYLYDEQKTAQIKEKCNSALCLLDYLKRNPQNNSLRLLYASALEKEGRYDEAIEVLNKYISLEKLNENREIAKNRISKLESLKNKRKAVCTNCNKPKIDKNRDYYKKITSPSVIKNAKNLKVYVGINTKKELALNMFKLWDKKLGDIVNFNFVNDKNNADIVLEFVNEPSKIGSDLNSDGSMGEVQAFYESYDKNIERQVFEKAVIKINTLSSKTKKEYPQNIMGAIILHEIAHSLGVNIHSDSQSDIMYPITDKIETFSPSQRDINTIKKLYSFKTETK